MAEAAGLENRQLKLPKRVASATGRERFERSPLSSTTVLKRLRALNQIFRLAVRWGVLEFNPLADMEKPAAAKGSTRYLTADEFRRLQEASEPWVRPLQRLAVSTGMRLKEVASLRWESVDTAGRVLVVAEETKTGAREVTLGQVAIAVLEEQRSRPREVGGATDRLSPFVFTSDAGDDYSSEAECRRISEVTRRAARAAGLGAGVGFHVLRHTAASWMVSDGVPLFDAQNVLGHSTPLLTQRYAHLAPGHLSSAVSALDRALGHVETATQVATQGPTSGAHRS